MTKKKKKSAAKKASATELPRGKAQRKRARFEAAQAAKEKK